MRRAFIMKLKPEALGEYARHHGAVWPELEAEMVKAGIREFREVSHFGGEVSA